MGSLCWPLIAVHGCCDGVRRSPRLSHRGGLVETTKKADAAEDLEVFHRVGLLINEPPGCAGLLFIQSSNCL
jgi:hypothetical protein